MARTPGTVVVALGGNALAPDTRATIHDQFRHTRDSLDAVVDLARQGWRIALVHGNGPQVGDALERNERARDRVQPLPLGVLVAGTAGWIGYMIQQSLRNALEHQGIDRDVLTIITQTVVAESARNDKPTKPIGHPMDPAAAERRKAIGVPIGPDGSGRLRRLAPSPAPIAILEIDAVRQLVAEGKIVIAAGGGGPPVYHSAGGWEGIDGVVDKDRSAAVLGVGLGADTLVILTNVDAVYEHWGTNRQQSLRRLTVEQAERLLSGDGLGEGSMRPKVEAAVQFVKGGGRRTVIAHLLHGPEAMRGEAGTTITGDD